MNREQMAAYVSRRRAERRARGMCVETTGCPRAAADGHPVCEEHLERRRERNGSLARPEADARRRARSARGEVLAAAVAELARASGLSGHAFSEACGWERDLVGRMARGARRATERHLRRAAMELARVELARARDRLIGVVPREGSDAPIQRPL